MNRSKNRNTFGFFSKRFSPPFCPGVSTYDDDTPDGGKTCKGTMGLFKIDKNGKCNSPKGCSLAVSGPVCPGVSRGIMDLPGGGRQCTVPGSNTKFEIDSKGKCVDKENNICATSLTSVLKSAGKAIVKGANAVGEAVGSAVEAYNQACPGGYSKDPEHVIPQEWIDKGAVSACKDGDNEAYLDASGKQLLGKLSRKKSMCYMRKQKGKKSKKRVCLNSSALMRLKKGARKGGKKSHR